MNQPVDYLSGPMSGKPYFNIPVFDAAAAVLRSRGRKVISPAELDDAEFRYLCLRCETGDIQELQSRCQVAGIEPETWGDLLARDIKLLANDGIENIVCLPGWTRSRGARLETFAGRMLDLNILSYPSLDPVDQAAIKRAHGVEFADGGAIKSAYFPPGETITWEGCKPALSEDTLPPPRESFREPKLREYAAPGAYCATGTSEVRVTDPTTGGEKGEKDEVEGDLCPKALIQLAKVCGFGRQKYSRANYLRGYKWSSSYDAMQRHLKAFWAGEEINDESGLHHLAHGAWHALALLAFTIRKVGTDDRI